MPALEGDLLEDSTQNRAEQGESLARRRTSWLWPGAISAAIFFLLGCCFAGYAGLQNDEALFAAPLARSWCFFCAGIGWNQRVPLMLMSYLGTLKTWLYAPIFATFGPSTLNIRLLALFIGAVTLLLFCMLLTRVHSSRAAWFGGLLLATDPMYVLTTTFDWGPVALQHLLETAAILLAVCWFQSGRRGYLAGAALCCGLGLWDKVLFVWVLSGMVLGALIWVPALWRRLCLIDFLITVATFCLGAAPLIAYNLTAPARVPTVRENLHFEMNSFRYKLWEGRLALRGSSLFGYLVNENSASQPRSPSNLLEKSAFQIHATAGEHRSNYAEIGMPASLLLLPFVWRRMWRAILFCLIAMVTAWLFMAFTPGGGVAAHHQVLLWPLPQLFMALIFAETARRIPRFNNAGLVAAAAVLVAGNLLVLNQYLYQFARNGPGIVWTNAISSVARSLQRSGADRVVVADWGMFNCLAVLNRDQPPIQEVDRNFMAMTESQEDRQSDLDKFADRKTIWLEHTPGNEVFPGVNESVRRGAAAAGFEELPLATYFDRNGRPVFLTFRFVSVAR